MKSAFLLLTSSVVLTECGSAKISEAPVDTHPQSTLVSQDCESPIIKGVTNDEGEKVFLLPEDDVYEATEAESYFCSEAYAKVAGYQKYTD